MHTERQLSGAMHQARIADPEAFRSVLVAIRQHFGSDERAGKALGMSQSQFTRLKNGTVHKRIRFDNYRRIREVLAGHAVDFGLEEQFVTSVLTPEGDLVSQRYQAWLDGEFERLDRKVRSVFARLSGFPIAVGYIRGFMKQVTRSAELPGPDEKRIWIALYRAIEPLADAQVTWGFERSWEEMHKTGDLARFLNAGLARERVMLNRENDYDRLHKCQAPDEYWNGLAPPDEEGARYMSPNEFFAGLDEATPQGRPANADAQREESRP